MFGMQLDIESRKRKRMQRTANARIEELVSMGFDRSRGKRKLFQTTVLVFYNYFFYHIDSTIVRDIFVNSIYYVLGGGGVWREFYKIEVLLWANFNFQSKIIFNVS